MADVELAPEFEDAWGSSFDITDAYMVIEDALSYIMDDDGSDPPFIVA